MEISNYNLLIKKIKSNKMAKNKAFIMEHVWLMVTVISIGFGIHATIKEGIGEGYVFGIIALFSIALFFWRRNLRKNEDN